MKVARRKEAPRHVALPRPRIGEEDHDLVEAPPRQRGFEPRDLPDDEDEVLQALLRGDARRLVSALLLDLEPHEEARRLGLRATDENVPGAHARLDRGGHAGRDVDRTLG